MQCDNGHTWVAGTHSSLYRASRGWNLPGRLVRVLLDRRTAQPVPLFMVGVTVAGLVLGILLDAVSRWRWWLVALLTPVLVWLGFLATAFSRRERGGLLAELVGEISHRRGREMDRERVRRMLAAAPSPPLGLAGWDGRRTFGGRSSSGDEIRSIELVHGDRPASPYLAVTTTWRAPHERLPGRRDLAPRGRHRWQPITLPVNGVDRPFTYLRTERGWVARAQLAAVVIELEAVGMPLAGVALEPVVDLSEYD